MKRILFPSAARFFIICINSLISCGVKTAVGSSNIKISLSRYNILRISVRCCIPTVISSIIASGSIARPYFSESAITFSLASAFFKKPNLFGSTPKIMLSKTEKHSTSLKCWCTIPIPKSFASFGLLIFTSLPSFLITPSSGWYKPNNTLIKVDFPAPFSPRRA